MKQIKKYLFGILLLIIGGAAVAAPLNVITTTPDLAQIAKAVGGEKIRVESLATGYQNPHFVEAKPSLVLKLMKADAFIVTGLDLELGWAPSLIRGARNRKIQPGNPGYIDASTMIKPMDVPINPSRAEGDVHPGGNPHYLLDPTNAFTVADYLATRLSKLDPDNKEEYSSNAAAFKNDLEKKIDRWTKEMEIAKGAKFISYHRSYSYFANRFGLVSIGEIEPKPGIPPSGAHTGSLINEMNDQKVSLIFVAPWFENRTPEFIAKKTGAKIIEFALYPGSNPNLKTYSDAVNSNIQAITSALEAK